VTDLSDMERTDARRFCGYAARGTTATGFDGWRFHQPYALLEYRMNNMSAAELMVMRRYLSALNGLELAVPLAAQNLDTDRAAVWVRNKDESHDRLRLLDDWRRRLCAFLGVPPGPGLPNSNITLVV
jgi:hypothetical protein